MSWIFLSLASALFLGLYDLAKKSSVRDNAVPAVLFLNVSTAAFICTGLLVANRIQPASWAGTVFEVDTLELSDHARLFFKSVIVGTSWSLAFAALKHLPLSIAAPIRSTSPMWTCLLAILLLGERPGWLQASGVLLIVIAFLLFSGVGKLEGLHFHRDRWVIYMVAATALGALSSLYDKYLLQTCGLRPATVQTWFSIYLVVVTLPSTCIWFRNERAANPFQWRWTIPAIAVMLLIADLLYFCAVADTRALISVVSPLRRTAVLIPFVYGTFVLGEQNWRRKAGCICLMLLGVLLISFG